MTLPTQAEGVPRTVRTLVATDFSAQAERALEWARYLADLCGRSSYCFHVIDIFTQAEVGCRMGESDPLHLLREQSKRCMGETEAFSVGVRRVHPGRLTAPGDRRERLGI